MLRRLVALHVVVIIAAAAFNVESRADTRVSDPVISAAAAHELLGKPGIVFLHVGRDAEAFQQGHIAGARFLPLGAFTEERDGVPFELPSVETLTRVFGAHGIERDARVIIYSDPSLGDIEVLAAARAFFSLEATGHRNVQVIDGGLDAWRRAEFDLQSGESAGASVDFEPWPVERDFVLTADDVALRLEDASLFLVDARPPQEYSGETPGTDVRRPGHIPGARNLFWKDFLQEDGTLKPTEELAAMWTRAGATNQHDVVVYCRTGMQASYAYLVARHLGISPRMYDASYIDWSNNTEYPVEGSAHHHH